MKRTIIALSLILLVACLFGSTVQASVSIPDEVVEEIKGSIDEARDEFASLRNIVEAALANPDFTTPEAESLFSEAVALAEDGDYPQAMDKLDASLKSVEMKKLAVKTYWTMIAYLICYLCFFGFIAWVLVRSREMERRLKA